MMMLRSRFQLVSPLLNFNESRPQSLDSRENHPRHPPLPLSILDSDLSHHQTPSDHRIRYQLDETPFHSEQPDEVERGETDGEEVFEGSLGVWNPNEDVG